MPSAPVMAASTPSCCTMSQAPLPEAKVAPAALTLEDGSALISVLAFEVVDLENAGLVDVPPDTSSPPLQPFLCTFLI